MVGNAASLRIGVLGASRISPTSIVESARLTGTRLVAVAARDHSRAQVFANLHGVDRVLDSYADVLRDAGKRVGVIVVDGFHYLYRLRDVAEILMHSSGISLLSG